MSRWGLYSYEHQLKMVLDRPNNFSFGGLFDGVLIDESVTIL